MKLAWSNLARQEMQALRRYSIERWGGEVARRYLEDIRDAARQISAQPNLVKPLRAPYRIFRVRSHHLILHLDEPAGLVTIARILHATMDIERHLP